MVPAGRTIVSPGDYDTWRLRIESYIQLQDYALWEIIVDGNSFKPVARTTTNADVTSTSTIPGVVTADEKIQKKNDLKSRSTLMMTLPSLGSISFNDLYNNFKIIEQEVKRSVISSSNSSSQNVAFVSTPSSTNDVNASNIHAFLANQLNGSQVVHEDLEQIHEDDLKEMDLKWQLALLIMKARKFYQRTGKKIIINGSDIVGYDKTKRTVNVEETSSKAMLAIDGVGFDWSFMSEEKTPTNFALMAFSDSEVHNNKTCSKTCLKGFEELKSQYDNLRIELNKSEFDLANYKRGLAYVEEQLVFYKKIEGMLCDQIVVLKRDASFNESEINALKIQIDRLKKEKESNQIKIDNFENSSKSLDKLIGCQISNNNRKGVGYNAVAPPPTGLFTPPTIDLSSSGVEEFQQPEFEGYRLKVSDCDEDETVEKVSESANAQKPKQADQPRKVSQNPRNNSTNWNTPMSKKLGVGFQFTPKAYLVCGSFNHLIKDCDFHDKKMVQKPVLNNEKRGTGQRKVRPVWNNAMRTNHQNFSNSRRNFAPTTVLTKSGLVPISAARQNSLKTAATVSAARPIKTVAPKPFVNVAKARLNAFQKSHSPSRRPFYQQTALKSINLNNKVNTVKTNSVNTAKGKK
ncbi:hypothetical protein Tco_1366757, partial [Tanacetum coccineum]